MGEEDGDGGSWFSEWGGRTVGCGAFAGDVAGGGLLAGGLWMGVVRISGGGGRGQRLTGRQAPPCRSPWCLMLMVSDSEDEYLMLEWKMLKFWVGSSDILVCLDYARTRIAAWR